MMKALLAWVLIALLFTGLGWINESKVLVAIGVGMIMLTAGMNII